jgi:hypothetical protein
LVDHLTHAREHASASAREAELAAARVLAWILAADVIFLIGVAVLVIHLIR